MFIVDPVSKVNYRLLFPDRLPMSAAIEEDYKKQQAEANCKNPENHRVSSCVRYKFVL
jgi:hypothetical protein